MAKAGLNCTLTSSIPTARGHALGHGRVPELLWVLWSPGVVPACAPVPHLTSDSQVLGSAEGRAPHPVSLVPVLVPTLVCPCVPQGDVQHQAVAQFPLKGFQAVLLHPILAEKDSGSGRLQANGALKQNPFSFPSTKGVQDELRSREVTWGDGTGMPRAALMLLGLQNAPGCGREESPLRHPHTGNKPPLSRPIINPHTPPSSAPLLCSHHLGSCRCPGWSWWHLHRGAERVLFRGAETRTPPCPCPDPRCRALCWANTFPPVWLHPASPSSPGLTPPQAHFGWVCGSRWMLAAP